MTRFAVGLVLIAVSSIATGILCSELRTPLWLTAILGGLAAIASVNFLLPVLAP